jgi:hypothetical protein
MARGCTSHCLNCDRHFSSDSAFSAHRAGSYRKGGMRQCLDPGIIQELDSMTSHCRIAEGKAKGEAVTVWFDHEAREKLAQVFKGREK